jgi:hypothetical protein
MASQAKAAEALYFLRISSFSIASLKIGLASGGGRQVP